MMHRVLLGMCVLASPLLSCSSSDDQSGDASSGRAGQAQGGGSQGGSTPRGGATTHGGGSARAGTSAEGGDAEAGAESGGSGAGAPSARGSCAIDKRLGRFAVESQKDFGVVQGAVLDGVVPAAIPELVAERDGCKLWRRRNLACSPACVSDETCGEAGKCIPYPRQTSVGEVVIEGLTRGVTMAPQMPGAVYFAPGQDNPPFAPSATVRLAASGSTMFGAFELFGRGSEPLLEEPTWVLEQGKALELSWPPGTELTSIFVELTIDQHGSSPLSLVCELPDTGKGSVSAELVEQVIESGVSGFPNGRLQRRTVDHVDSQQGCIELSVGSARAAKVRVAGFTPCKTDAECPSGLTCDVTQERCH